LDPGNYVFSAYFRLITGFFPNDTLPQFKQQRDGRDRLSHQPYWWRCHAFRQMKCLMRWIFLIKVIQYLLNDCRVFNTGNDPDVTATFATLIGLLEGPFLAVSGGSHF